MHTVTAPHAQVVVSTAARDTKNAAAQLPADRRPQSFIFTSYRT